MSDRTQAQPIPEFPGYSITADGRIFSARRGLRELAQQLDRHGYPCVHLYRPDGTRAQVRVHQAVLLTFAGPKPTPRSVCRHLNGERTDNRIANLAWGTQAENIADAMRQGTATQIGRYGEDANSAKLTEAQVLEIEQRARAGGEFLREIGADYGITPRHVSLIRDHGVWKHLWPRATA